MRDGRSYLGHIKLMKTFEIFPTPISVTNIKISQNLINYFKTVEMFTQNESINYGFYSKDTQILRSKPCEELRKIILKDVTEYSREVLCFDTKGMLDVHSWVSVKLPGQNHVPHGHPNCAVTAVFYFDDVQGECPLSFHKNVSRGSNTFEMRPKFDEKKLSESKYSDTTYFKPDQFDMLIFPSYQIHGVPANTSKKNRYSLAMNFVPMNELGTKDNLTHFIYNNAIV